MIEKLRIKFIGLSVGIVFVVVATIISAINYMNYSRIVSRADNLLQILIENNGYFPEIMQHMSPEVRYSTRFFSVSIDDYGNIVAIDRVNIASKTNEEVVDYSNAVLKENKERGFIDQYRYKIAKTNSGGLIVFIDCSEELDIYKSFLKRSIVVSSIGIGTIFLIIVMLSKKMVEPIAKSYERQKQFITDAGHELKTPLTIISTNTDVLEIVNGESEWTKNIHSQIIRLNNLVSSLVSLSRMDEEKNELVYKRFIISDVAEEIIESFKLIMDIDNKKIIKEIEKDLEYYGDENLIRQLISILVDNAVKYSEKNTDIIFVIKKDSKKVFIKIENISTNLVKGDLSYLFERFVRGDESRNSTVSGHGIGLSLAKAITLKNKGHIHAYSPDGKKFVVELRI